MLRIVFLLIMSFLLVSCMQSYTVPRATIHLQTQDPSEIELVKNTVDKFLLERGFVNKGIDEHMLELFTRSSGNHNENQFQINHIEKLKKTIHYENKGLDMRVQTLDFSSLEFKKKHVQYEYSKVTIEDKPAVELNIYNSRPGGFSIKALDLYNDLINSKSITDISEVVVIYSPPPNNQREFYTFKVFNVLSFGSVVDNCCPFKWN